MGYNRAQYPNREFDYLILNNQNSILKNKDIRKAINYAIDKNEINYNIYNNKYYICSFPLDYESFFYNKDIKVEYDIDKAKNILIQNGWKFKKNIFKKNGISLRLRLLVNKENKRRLKVSENIKEQLKRVGIEIDVIAVSNNKYENYLRNKKYDMVLSGNIISNNPNLETYFGKANLSNFSNNEMTNIINEIKSIDNQEEILKEKYTRIEEIYKEEMPFISLYFNSLFILSSKNLKGDFTGNWYNIFYNIDTWYKIINSKN